MLDIENDNSYFVCIAGFDLIKVFGDGEKRLKHTPLEKINSEFKKPTLELLNNIVNIYNKMEFLVDDEETGSKVESKIRVEKYDFEIINDNLATVFNSLESENIISIFY
jgi:hypothetical protein